MLFNNRQIQYMNSIGLYFDFNDLSSNEICKISDTVSKHLQIHGFDKNYRVTSVGSMCESILDAIGEI